jgi:DNA polymerase-1
VTTLLIDADVYLWRASSAVQKTFDFGDNVFATGADFGEARDKFDSEIRDLVIRLKAGHVVMGLSDVKRNWRKEVMPTYKANRGTGKPKVFYQLREHVEHEYNARWFPGLEGDDVLGLYSTGRSIPGKKIIVSIDKDMMTVPGLLFNPNKPERGVRKITLEEADEYHLMQTLTGDPVDGYPGCPGIGPKRAAVVLQGLPGHERWAAIVNQFVNKGLTEVEALQNARVARILRAGEYSAETHRVKLWEPTRNPPPSISAKSKTPGNAKGSRRVRSGTRAKGRAGSTSSRRCSSDDLPYTSRTGPASTGTGTGKRGSRSRGTSTRPSAT